MQGGLYYSASGGAAHIMLLLVVTEINNSAACWKGNTMAERMGCMYYFVPRGRY